MSFIESVRTFMPMVTVLLLAFLVAEFTTVFPRKRGDALERWRLLLVFAILAAVVTVASNIGR